MRQTPFGVWNPLPCDICLSSTPAPMRQTPFGVWNSPPPLSASADFIWAPMRQTPFGVWNSNRPNAASVSATGSNEADAFRRLELVLGIRSERGRSGSNEADAFRRLEFDFALTKENLQAGSNEADAFRRLESGHAARRNRRRHDAPMRQTPFGVWNCQQSAGLATPSTSSNEADAFRRLECGSRRFSAKSANALQ